MELPADRQPKPRRSSSSSLTNVDEVRDTAVPDLLTDPMELEWPSRKPLSGRRRGHYQAPRFRKVLRLSSRRKKFFPLPTCRSPFRYGRYASAQRGLRQILSRCGGSADPVPTPTFLLSTICTSKQPCPNRKVERFGLDIFRNGSGNLDILPMDLPVGPDYVVGPGDSLSINLWGGVSERLEIPKQPGFVLTIGQVYNSNAITYTPGKNVNCYLSRAGGATGLANKGAIFILRANGSVTSGSSGLWSKRALSAGAYLTDGECAQNRRNTQKL